MTYDFVRDRERLNAERQALLGMQAAQPFDRKSERLLNKLPIPLMKELRLVLRKTPTRDGQMNPQAMADSSREILLQAVLDCCHARSRVGLDTTSTIELGTSETLSAIERQASFGRVEGNWGAARIAMLLAVVRKLVIFVQGHCNPLINERQRQLTAMVKKPKDHRVYLPEEYLSGAVAITVFSRVLGECGFLHSEILARDAAMLALDTKVYARLGELFNINVGDVRNRVAGDKLVLSVTIKMTKTHKDRIVTIYDERVVELVKPLLEASDNAPLFRTIEGNRLTYSAVANALERTCNLAVGERGGAGIMRRSATKRVDGRRKDAGSLLGHKDEKTSRDYYTPNQSALGLQLIQNAAAQAAKQTRSFKKAKQKV